MSQQNVEIIKAATVRWNAGDMGAVRDLFHPNAIVCLPDGWPEPGPFVGGDAILRQFEQNREVWDSDRLTLSNFVDAGDRVVVRLTWSGVGRGLESQLDFTAVYTMRKGQVTYQESFWDHAEALEALGLTEQDAHADS
jgi:ketosteroid isomerase-like protein